MNFNKRVNGSWTDVPHYIHNTATDTITTLPADLYADGNNATVGISGNTVQTGTPTPDNPSMPQGTGDRTENLYNVSAGAYQTGARYISDGEVEDNANYSIWTIGVSTLSSGTYTFSLNSASTSTTTLRVVGFKNGVKVGMIGATQIVNMPLSITVTDAYDEIRFSVANGYVGRIMLNAGQTALPYEPYGYKTPISSASTTTPVYLGETESTRKINRLVLTGDASEQWEYVPVGTLPRFRCAINALAQITQCVCTHYRYELQNADGNIFVNSTLNTFTVCDSNFTSLEQWKSYLAQQYTAGTPVTVWYVLATPETAVVNEPLRKIGDYADTLSGITIPTIAGANSFDVLATLKPSEVTVNYKGWHDAVVHERDNGAWTE